MSGAPTVPCDDCESPMPIPAHCLEAGVILGRLVCTQCTEDYLDARTFEPRAEVGMVGASR